MMNRRRFIAISGVAAGLGLFGANGVAVSAPEAVTWRGTTLGASASLTIHHPDRAVAERLVREVLMEVEKLEQVFSLYRVDSSLSQLNLSGALAAPPADLVHLLDRCRDAWELTDGAFDPTVQPLWTLLARHFSRADADPTGPSSDQFREALSRVGFDRVVFDPDRIVLERGMALTFNGIAQGYITDRAVEILRRGGIISSLGNMGEIRGLGRRPDGDPWRSGIHAGRGVAGLLHPLELVDRAIATSSGDGFAFSPSAGFNHLLDPRSGDSAPSEESITVTAPDAAGADAFSTAFSLMRHEAIRHALNRRPEINAFLLDSKGAVRTL